MRTRYFAILLLLPFFNWSQGLYNEGTLQVHAEGNLGLHADLINNGALEGVEGSNVGFYGNTTINVSGVLTPFLYDIELMNDQNVMLNNSLNVGNNLNFVFGQMNTPKNIAGTSLQFSQDAFYVGESDQSHVNGFVSIADKNTFTFPVGDNGQLRSLSLQSSATNAFAQCIYFYQNPDNQNFDPLQHVRDVGEVSTFEFWILESDIASTITVSWNENSNLGNIANQFEDIILVGWSKTINEWLPLGNTAMAGDLNEGFITSDTFVPNDFEAITFGTVPLPTESFVVENPTLGNYFLSPNGDGTNDSFIIDNLEGTGSNQVAIFNRAGQKVFEFANYTDEFRGFANVDGLVINSDIGLPEGVYYYTISLPEVEGGLSYQGFLFLDR